MKQLNEYIICSAIHFNDGIKHKHQPKNIELGFIVAGRRHHNCFITAHIIANEDWRRSVIFKDMIKIQGFLTNHDRFLDRTESYHLAVQAGQITDNSETKSLISEDLL